MNVKLDKIYKMRKMRNNSKKRLGAWMMMLAMSMSFVGCTDNNSTPVAPEPEPEPEQEVKTASDILLKIEGVSIIKDTIDANKNPVTYFYFEQPIDHEDASAGTFAQYCVMHYKGPDHPTVLQTQGYSIPARKSFRPSHIAQNLDANFIEVEHRYYRNSLINYNEQTDYYNPEYWKYNTAAQSTADLHAIVTALKATGCFKDKWLSTGGSKSGMLTALYAYYYPNDIDLYVPFCAPFCTGLESRDVGKYLTWKCGEGTEAYKRLWEAYRRMGDESETELRDQIAALYKADYPNSASIQKYSTQTALCVVLDHFMRNLFDLFAYKPLNTWADVIPQPGYSAQVYYDFSMLSKTDFDTKLRDLRDLMDLEVVMYERYLEDEGYDINDDWVEDEEYYEDEAEGGAADTRAAQRLPFEKFLFDIYFIQASMELGQFLYDYSKLPASYPKNLIGWMDNRHSNTRYNNTYHVTYDGGRLMDEFLAFVKDNRNQYKCKMLFIYGGNDPWTGAAIPDPDPDDPYVKKHIVPGGVHSTFINYKYYYTAEERDWIMNTIREMLK